MGNDICCDAPRIQPGLQSMFVAQIKQNHDKQSKAVNTKIFQNSGSEDIQIPPLKDKVNFTLNKYDFSSTQIDFTNNCRKKYGDDLYDGQIDENNKPNGYGQMYLSDGSLYLGLFLHGKAHGKGAFIFSDGSFYKGDFVNNSACSEQGHYQSDQLIYYGGFKNNTFDGNGQEKGRNHQFIGTFEQGNKKEGLFVWNNDSEEYSYQGSFNSKNQFHGHGVLKDSKGIYEGSFVNGVKEGQGCYKGINSFTYKGQYKNGYKNGNGTITDRNGYVVYSGEILNGLPHGKGWSYNQKGVQIQSFWIEGVNSNLI